MSSPDPCCFSPQGVPGSQSCWYLPRAQSRFCPVGAWFPARGRLRKHPELGCGLSLSLQELGWEEGGLWLLPGPHIWLAQEFTQMSRPLASFDYWGDVTSRPALPQVMRAGTYTLQSLTQQGNSQLSPCVALWVLRVGTLFFCPPRTQAVTFAAGSWENLCSQNLTL